jgi:hypothetical protein
MHWCELGELTTAPEQKSYGSQKLAGDRPKGWSPALISSLAYAPGHVGHSKECPPPLPRVAKFGVTLINLD